MGVVEFFREPPAERRRIVFSAIRAPFTRGSCQTTSSTSPSETIFSSPSPPTITPAMNRVMEDVVVVDHTNPYVRAATLAGMTSVIFKAAERALNSTRFQTNLATAKSSLIKGGLSFRDHFGKLLSWAPSKGLENAGDVRGQPPPGFDDAVLYAVEDSQTRMTTLKEIIGPDRSAIFFLEGSGLEESVHLQSIVDASAKLKAYGIDKIVCVVNGELDEVQRLREREKVPGDFLILSDPSSGLEKASGLRLGSKHSAFQVDLGVVVSIHECSIDEEGTLQSSVANMITFLVSQQNPDIVVTPTPQCEKNSLDRTDGDFV